MAGLVADINVQGHLPYLRQVLEALGLWSVLRGEGIIFATFREVGLARKLDDRSVWNFCQNNGWVLFTEDRNDDGPDSLQATVQDSWHEGQLPILTLANKGRFENDPGYAKRVATDVAELLFGIIQGDYRDQPRIYLPK